MNGWALVGYLYLFLLAGFMCGVLWKDGAYTRALDRAAVLEERNGFLEAELDRVEGDLGVALAEATACRRRLASAVRHPSVRRQDDELFAFLESELS